MEAKIQKVKLSVIIEHHRLTGKAKQAQETDKPKEVISCIRTLSSTSTTKSEPWKVKYTSYQRRNRKGKRLSRQLRNYKLRKTGKQENWPYKKAFVHSQIVAMKESFARRTDAMLMFVLMAMLTV